MSDRIDLAARVIADHIGFLDDLGSDPQSVQEVYLHPVALARALDRAGLIAPAPLGREWAIEITDPWGDLRYDRHPTREAAEDARWSDDNDRLVHRWATAWEPADGIDRSEGGGKAATSG